MTAPAPLLSIEGLQTGFPRNGSTALAVDGASFTIPRGRTVGLVGESGCGKTLLALSVLRLVPPPGRIVGGRIRLDGTDLLKLDDAAMRKVRGRRIALIFQEPMTALNPVLSIRTQITEVLRLHRGMSRAEARTEAVALLRRVGIPDPETRVKAYPHQLSGGMRQRAMIAIALACRPDLLIADEPTTALDVTVQAQILDLLERLQRDLGMSILLITHDLSVVAEAAHEVVIMYAGRVVERAPVRGLFEHPLHPYTRGLLASVDRSSDRGPRGRKPRLSSIPGNVPAPGTIEEGCPFEPRCPIRVARCKTADPPLEELRKGHGVACWEAHR